MFAWRCGVLLLLAVQGNGMEAKEEPYQEESPACDDPNLALPVLAEPGDALAESSDECQAAEAASAAAAAVGTGLDEGSEEDVEFVHARKGAFAEATAYIDIDLFSV